MCRYATPGSDAWACNCHNEGPDLNLGDHEHVIDGTLTFKVEAAPAGDWSEMDVDDVRKRIINHLRLTAEMLEGDKSKTSDELLRKVFNSHDEDSEDCPTCTALKEREGDDERERDYDDIDD